MTTAKKNCFVISPIGEDGSETRKRADQVLRHIVTPAVQSCGYEAVRADKISEPGLITSQVIQHIVEDPLVLADLTGMNPNVFYELAIRHAIRKPLVQIIQKGEKIPFDVASMRTVPVDHRDLDSVDEAKSEIEKQIKAVEGKKPNQIESPISVSVELQSLRTSERPEDRSLAEIVTAIAQMRAELTSGLNLVEKRSAEMLYLSREAPVMKARPFVEEAEIGKMLSELRAILQRSVMSKGSTKGEKEERDDILRAIDARLANVTECLRERNIGRWG